MSSPTIKDVAKLAGVSISTVSRVMNNSKPVSPEARRKVEDAIKKLDFKPNELARSLVRKSSNLIGVMVKDIGIPYIANIIRGIEEVGRMYKYDILLTSTYGDLDEEKRIVEFLFTKQVEGIIFISEDIDKEVFIKIKNYNIPFLAYDKYDDFKGIDTVGIDHFEAAKEMTKYLIDEGHRNILHVKELEMSKVGNDKYSGYKEALEKNNLIHFEITANDISIDEGYNMGERINRIVESEDITAIFFADDNLAIGYMNYCYDDGKRIPDYVSVVGFGDLRFSSIYRPTLTTINEPYYDIGAVMMRRLIKTLKKEETPEGMTYLPYQLIKRDSIKNVIDYTK